jgi:hypothetical protein
MTNVQTLFKTLLISKQCSCCRRKFTPRTRNQKYCSNKKCQSKRKRFNRRAWQKNPENKKFIRAQQRRWRKGHPEYLKQWRKKHPESVKRNKRLMKTLMRRKRRRVLFEKSNSSILQTVGNKGDVFTNLHATIILMRLKRGHGLSKAWRSGYACHRIRSSPVRLPQGRLYKVSGSL